MLEAKIVPVWEGKGEYDDRFRISVGEVEVVSRAPVFDLCRKLIEAGYEDQKLVVFGPEGPRMIVPSIARGALTTVQENGLCWRKYQKITAETFKKGKKDDQNG